MNRHEAIMPIFLPIIFSSNSLHLNQLCSKIMLKSSILIVNIVHLCLKVTVRPPTERGHPITADKM